MSFLAKSIFAKSQLFWSSFFAKKLFVKCSNLDCTIKIMGPRNYIVLDKYEDFDLSQFVYQVNDENPASTNLEIKYSGEDGRLLKVYLKTPILELGRLCRYQGRDYLDLQILDSYHSDFRDYLVTLDQYHLAQLESNQKIWGFDGSVRQTVLSQRFRNLLNFSSDSQHEYLLVEVNQPKLFDQNDRRRTTADLKPGLKGRAVLELGGLYSQANQIFYTQINLVQIKVRLPDPESSQENPLGTETKTAEVKPVEIPVKPIETQTKPVETPVETPKN